MTNNMRKNQIQKTLLLLAMITVLMPSLVMVYAQGYESGAYNEEVKKVTGPVWTKYPNNNSGEWYIFNDSMYTVGVNTQGTQYNTKVTNFHPDANSVYFPSSVGTVIKTCAYISGGVDGLFFYVKLNGQEVNSTNSTNNSDIPARYVPTYNGTRWSGYSKTFYGTATVSQTGMQSIQAGWYSPDYGSSNPQYGKDGDGNQQNKRYGVRIPVPRHMDFDGVFVRDIYVKDLSADGESLTTTVNLSFLYSYIKSYRIDANVVVDFIGENANLFSINDASFLNYNSSYPVYAQTGLFGNNSAQIGQNLPTSIADKTITYRPVDMSEKTCTLAVKTKVGTNEYIYEAVYIVHGFAPEHITYDEAPASTLYLGKFDAGNTLSKEIDLADYIKSFNLASNKAVTATLIGGNGLFKFSDGTTSTTLVSATAPRQYARVGIFGPDQIGELSDCDRTVMYYPSDNTEKTCTLQISAEINGVAKTKNILLSASQVYEFFQDGNWSDGNKWRDANLQIIGHAPSITDDVTISAKCTVNTTSAVCDNLQFNTGGSLTIPTTGVLTVDGTLNNTAESVAERLHIDADANGSGTLIFHNIDGCDNGPWAEVEMYIPQTTEDISRLWKEYKWRYMGSPVKAGQPSDVNYIFQWDESDSGDGDKDGWNECWQQVSGNITAWTGYAMGSIADPIHTIIGQLTNCDKEVSLAYGSKVHADRGNNLITNSYTAPISLSQLTTADFGGAQATVYFFNSGTHADWVTNGGKGTGPGQYEVCPISSMSAVTIPSGQAFFVKANASNQKFQFRYETVAQSASGKAHAPKVKEEFNVLTIRVEGKDSTADLLYLMENENCSERFDNGYDGTKVLGVEGTPQLYATNDYGRTAVNVDQTITGQYVGFMAGHNGTKYTLSFNTDRLEGYDELYLYDTKENKYVNIMKGETYTFTGTRSGEEKRFLIVGQREDEDEAVVRTGDEQRIEVVGNRALVMGFDGSDADVRVVDMQGRVVCEWNMVNGPWFEIPDLPSGVYVISVEKCQTKFVK